MRERMAIGCFANANQDAAKSEAAYLAPLNAQRGRAWRCHDRCQYRGKTNTIAHRVADLIVNGADPGRIVLLTFSRRGRGDGASG
jgi:hypothetical protein